VSVASNPPVVGKTAKPDKFLNPTMVAALFKRHMHLEPPPVLLASPDGTEYTPVSLSAEVLHFMKRGAEKLTGSTIKKAVIGAPAYFEEPARRATKQAGLIAGFEQVHIVPEPTLAATAYGLAKGEDTTIAVFDFGGGTFDISILKVKKDGQIDPLAVHGDFECGGSNVDEAIFQDARTLLEKKGGQLSPEKDLAEWLEILDRCKEAKEMLAHKDSAIIPLRIGDERISMELTYQRLKELCGPIIDNLRQCCKKAMEKANLQPSQIEKVVLVGGSTRLRFIRELVAETFGKEPVGDTDPDTAVARGAAIIAAAYFGPPNRELIVEGKKYLASAVRPQKTISPRDLCVAAITKEQIGDKSEYNVPIIPAGSKLPYEATECFTPIDARATKVRVKLYDGHANELSKNCTPLQEAEVEVQPTDEASNHDRIEFKIGMDIEGLVDITVRDRLLNKPVPITFKFHTGLSDSEIDEAREQLLRRHKKADHEQ
jgi:molecular chaperone DnaK